MAGGGKRPGAGRPKGAQNKRTEKRQEYAEQILSDGKKTPLEIMIEMARGEATFDRDLLEAAKAAAPYVHPKLSSVEMNANVSLGHEDALDELE